MNVRAFGVEELNAIDSSEINGGVDPLSAAVAWGTALGTAFLAGFAWGYAQATE